MLTTNDIALIRWQLHTIEPFGDAIGAEFLTRLFWATPQARDFFPKDVVEVRGKVFDLISLTVEHLEHIEKVAPFYDALVTRPGHCVAVLALEPAIRVAFLGTLQNWLKSEFSDAARSAWSRAFTKLADAMQCNLPALPIRKAA